MPSLPSPVSDRSGRLLLMDDEDVCPDTWTTASRSTHGDDTGTQQQLPSTTRMSPATTYEVLHRIGQTFSHVQHAVCGNAAMVAYGFTARPPSHVSVVCPVYAREVIKSWAAATGGMAIYPGDPDVIGVADADGEVWKVRIKPLDGAESFEMLETVGMAFGGGGAVTRVLTMPALVNQIALSYVHGRHVGDESRMAALAGDLVWLLGRICEEGAESEHLLRAKSVPAVRDPRFWSDFTTAYPEIAGLFYDAGFRPDGCPTIEQLTEGGDPMQTRAPDSGAV
ncbi:hypothetical protein EsH8_VII_000951 [Colletotrichum jinshuiense]